MALSIKEPLKLAVTLLSLGVDVGADGYVRVLEEAAAAEVVAAWRGRSSPCRRGFRSSLFSPKSRVIALNVCFQGTREVERMMRRSSRCTAVSDTLWSLVTIVIALLAHLTYRCGSRSPSSLQPSCDVMRRKYSTL